MTSITIKGIGKMKNTALKRSKNTQIKQKRDYSTNNEQD
jgi:hypothetical protein